MGSVCFSYFVFRDLNGLNMSDFSNVSNHGLKQIVKQPTRGNANFDHIVPNLQPGYYELLCVSP